METNKCQWCENEDGSICVMCEDSGVFMDQDAADFCGFEDFGGIELQITVSHSLDRVSDW